ncbi:YezD family protein [Novosphingobium sp.]|uniref:YezD family protein n=1 Tax=Novosphingobium sp. TaxID=1874826 RepID=UPI0035B2ABDB
MADKPTLSIARPPASPGADRHAETLAAVRAALDTLRFGQVVLTVHEGKVVQLDVTEMQRFG